MVQIKTQQYARNTQTAEQKFAQAAYFLNTKISKALSVMKQKVSNWTSKLSSRRPIMASTIMIHEARNRDLVKSVDSTSYRRLLPVF